MVCMEQQNELASGHGLGTLLHQPNQNMAMHGQKSKLPEKQRIPIGYHIDDAPRIRMDQEYRSLQSSEYTRLRTVRLPVGFAQPPALWPINYALKSDTFSCEAAMSSRTCCGSASALSGMVALRAEDGIVSLRQFKSYIHLLLNLFAGIPHNDVCRIFCRCRPRKRWLTSRPAKRT